MVRIKGIDLFAPISMVVQRIKNETELHFAMATAMKIASFDPEEGTEDYNDVIYLLRLVQEYWNRTGTDSMTIPIEVFKLVFGFTEDISVDDEDVECVELC